MIRTDALSFAYHTDALPVFSEFDATFRRGALTAVTGPSGCGKSTLLYLLGLMLTPSAGLIELDGVDAGRLSDPDRARLRASRIGFVFQDALLDPSRTILDNVTEGGLYAGIPQAESLQRALHLLSAFGVERRSDRRPGEISGGQAQRVALCRALVKRPSVILADEPTGNLDRASADIVWSALTDAAAEGATVVVATHDVSRASHAAQIVEL
jgi:ABC-type lipoprotein export system ATPase subunit